MCGFSRRFDDSYRDAYGKVEKGLIGRPTILRSQTCDKHDPSGTPLCGRHVYFPG
jgi:myo-inositol 2-dehydrogenase/D-chiro-inositol 1-dehydrogenase